MQRLLLLALIGLAPTANVPAALAQTEAPDGAKLFARQCGTCHSLVAGEARQGPNLASVYGRKAGTVPNFKYSPGFGTCQRL